MTPDNPPRESMTTELFYSLWRPLFRFALGRGVGEDDAKDLVMQSIYAVIDKYEPERGDILVFAYTVLRNRMKNFFIKNHLTSPLTTELEDDAPSPLDEAIRREEEHRAREIFRKLEEGHTPEEIQFLKLLLSQIETDGTYNVSEAARSLGLKPLKGHDIFRKFKRHLHLLDRDGMLAEEPKAIYEASIQLKEFTMLSSLPSRVPEEDLGLLLQAADEFATYLRIAEYVKNSRS